MGGSTIAAERSFSKPSTERIGVLLADGNSAHHEAIRRLLLADDRIGLVECASASEASEHVANGSVDVVISELSPWGGHELEILLALAAQKPSIIICTCKGNEYWAAESIKRGASDYISKTPGYLPRLLSRVIEVAAERAAADALGKAQWSGDTVAYSRLLNALPVHLALIDERGAIRAVNHAWRLNTYENPFHNKRLCVGANYLEACDAATIPEAEAIAQGLRRVLAGECATCIVEYAYSMPEGQRWFKFAASPLRDNEHRGAIILNADITDRKQAELERDQIFEQSLALLCICGFDGYVQRWSPASDRLLGYTAAEMKALPVWEMVHPDDLAPAMKLGAEMLEGKTMSSMEMRVRAKDGSYRWILWDAVPCIEQKMFFATGQDITARKEIEQQLHESHQRFELIASNSKEAVWDWDLRNHRFWQNDGYRNIFGSPDPARESVVSWWRRRLHPEDRERVLASVPPNRVEGKEEWALEYRLARVDGTFAHVYDRGFVIFDEQGRPSRMVGSIIDISELKETEQKLRESEERFQLAAKASCDAIWDCDLQASPNQVWRSEAYQTLFGYKAEEIRPDREWWSERLHPDDRDRVMGDFPSPVDGTRRQRFMEYRFRRADGTYAVVYDRAFIMFNAEGKPIRIIGTLTDISERRKAEELAHMQQAELAHMSRLSTMGEIATGIAHELNQPLTAISNYAESCTQEITTSKSLDQEKLIDWIERIATNTHRAAEMIRRLRGFTRKSEPRRSTVEVGELINEVIDLLEAETRLKSMRVRFAATDEIFATVDRIQIQQVLVNLLRNAYEAMAENESSQRQVTIVADTVGKKINVSVEDLGEGIPGENLERVFDAFFTSKANGVGIGLAISRSIIEAHGGRLWVVPNAEQGVTFHFTLPLSGA